MSIVYDIPIPADVPESARATFAQNYMMITHASGRLMLFAGDQKIEHMNGDFYGEGIHADDADPEHLFRIAKEGRIGVFATQMGLIARYGEDYPSVPYLVKLNSKTNLVGKDQMDPYSSQITTVDQVARLRDQTSLLVAAVGYTVYLGSEFEHKMLEHAARIINEAHQYGLIVVLWVYPRGKAVKDEKDPHLIAGATGVAATIGADFVKVNAPKKDGSSAADLLKEATVAAGRTRVVCAGGSSVSAEDFLQQLYDQIHIGGASGNATGRNVHQKSFEEAVKMCNAISAITVDNADVQTAVKIYNE